MYENTTRGLEDIHTHDTYCKQCMRLFHTDATAAYLRAASLVQCDHDVAFPWFTLCLRPPVFVAATMADVNTRDAWTEIGAGGIGRHHARMLTPLADTSL